jgi:hypothetical protein
MNKQKFQILLLISLFLTNCEKRNDKLPHQPPKPVYFSKSWKADMDFKNGLYFYIFCDTNNSLTGFIRSKKELVRTTSKDYGLSWSTSEKIFDIQNDILPIIIKNRLLGFQVIKKVENGGQLYFYNGNQKNWDTPGSIRDTNWGDFSAAFFATDADNNIYCNWIDWRNGNPDVYYSFSTDSGKTWNANVQINDDQSGQEQNYSRLQSTADGTLYAFWEDNRNTKTLYDIFFSKSYDGGRTWRSNVKINDDTSYCWQKRPYAVLDGSGNIYVTWFDYRDNGIHNDLIANIYFTKSIDDGKTWTKNIRISNARLEHCLDPRLIVGTDNTIHCIYRSHDSKHRSDLYYSYSDNNGTLWSEPIRINDNVIRQPLEHKNIGTLLFDNEKVLVGWAEKRALKNPVVLLASRFAYPDSTRTERKPLINHKIEKKKFLIKFKTDKQIFSDDFTLGISNRWQENSGTWIWKDNMYIGYDRARSFLDTFPVSNFIFSGRFKLDRLTHETAWIYFRINENEHGRYSYYRIMNFFRHGVTIEYFNGTSHNQIANVSYPFQMDKWYSFQTIMKGSSLNYFVNDSLIVSIGELYKNPIGKLGIGTHNAPAYFKNITLCTIK